MRPHRKRWWTALVAVTLAGCGASAAQKAPAPGRTEGRALFVGQGCGACHTLAAAGARGLGGPNFDTSEKLDRAQIVRQLNTGTGGMPSFRARLTDRQEAAVAEFLFDATRRR